MQILKQSFLFIKKYLKTFSGGCVLGRQAAVTFLPSYDILHTYIVLYMHINTHMEHCITVALECLIIVEFHTFFENMEKKSGNIFVEKCIPIQLQ